MRKKREKISGTIVITQNIKTKAIIHKMTNCDQTQEAMALLIILALGNRRIEEGMVEPALSVFKRIRETAADT